MIKFVNSIKVITAEELRPKLIPQRKIFATTKSQSPKTLYRFVGHTPGDEYGGLKCNYECKINNFILADKVRELNHGNN